MGKKSLPLYQLLNGSVSFEWTSKCQRAFDMLKEYLSHAPLLVSPIEAEILFMYLAVTKVVISSIICSLRNKKMMPIYM